MTVYVDKSEWARSTSKKPRKLYSHMVASTLDELHEFARKIGVKRHFFHRSNTCYHYDITTEQQSKAIEHGAVLEDTRVLLKIGKEAMRPVMYAQYKQAQGQT